MAKARESVDLSFRADIGDLKKTLATIPGITEKEAKKMAKALESQMIRAEKAAKKAAKQTRVNYADASKKVATAALAAGAALGVLAQDVADTRNGITDLSTRTGVATDTIAGLKLAAEGSGLAFSDVESVLGRLPKTLADIEAGSKRQVDAFKALGVSTRDDVTGSMRSADAVLRDGLKALSAIEDPTERAARATDAFGRSGTKLLQALGDPGALEVFVSMAGQAAINNSAAATAAGEHQRAIAELNLALDSAKAQFVDGLGITGFVEDFTLGLTFVSAAASSVVDQISKQFQLMGKVVGEALDGNFRESGKAAAELALEVGKLQAMGVSAFFQEAGREGAKAAAAFHRQREAIRKASTAAGNYAGVVGTVGDTAKKTSKAIEEIGLEEEISLGDMLREGEAAADRFRDKIREAEEASMTPFEKLRAEIAEINELRETGALTALEAEAAAHFARLDFVKEESAARKEAADAADAASEAAAAKLKAEADEISAAYRQAFSSLGGAASGFSDLMNTISEKRAETDKDRAMKQFQTAKALAMVEATMNGAVAVTSALRIPIPVLREIAVAGALAGTAAQLAVIGSQQPSFMDTPGVMQAGGRAASVQFAPGDFFAAAQTRSELARQVNQDAGPGARAPAVQVIAIDRPLFKGRVWGQAERDVTRRPSPLGRAIRDASGESRTGRGGF